jgi:hypothetical protein
MCLYGLLIRLAWFPLFDGTLHDNSPSTSTSTTRCWIQYVLASMGWICLRCSWIRRISVTERLLEPETIGFESKTIVFEITTKGETSFICESRFLAVSCLFLSVGVSFIVLGFLFCSSHGYVLCRFCIMFYVCFVHVMGPLGRSIRRSSYSDIEKTSILQACVKAGSEGYQYRTETWNERSSDMRENT